MRESAVEKHFRKQVLFHGGWVRKMIWPGHKGAPDRLAIWPLSMTPAWKTTPWIDFVELKRPKGPTAEHQKREHDKLSALGCNVFVLDTIEAVDNYIRERTS